MQTAHIIRDVFDRDFADLDAAAELLESAREEAAASVTLDDVLESLTPEQRTEIDRHIARWELRHAGLILAMARDALVETTARGLLNKH